MLSSQTRSLTHRSNSRSASVAAVFRNCHGLLKDGFCLPLRNPRVGYSNLKRIVKYLNTSYSTVFNCPWFRSPSFSERNAYVNLLSKLMTIDFTYIYTIYSFNIITSTEILQGNFALKSWVLNSSACSSSIRACKRKQPRCKSVLDWQKGKNRKTNMAHEHGKGKNS